MYQKFLNPFICQWTARLLLYPCYCKQCFSEDWVSSCGTWAQLPHSIWNTPETGIRPAFDQIKCRESAFAGRFPTIGPAMNKQELVLSVGMMGSKGAGLPTWAKLGAHSPEQAR